MKRFRFWGRRRPSGDGEVPEQATLLTGDAREDENSLQILLESIAEVSSSMELDPVLDAIVDKSLEVTQAERAIVFLGGDPATLDIRTARDRDGTTLGRDLQYSRSVVRRSLEEGQPVRSVVRSDQEALELGQSVFDLKLRAVMCAPLQVKDRIVGAIYVDSRAVRREFSSRDLALFGALSTQLAIALDNARLHLDSLQKVALEKDVEIARRIQQHLLTAVPEVRGLDVAVRFAPCSQASGDTYDFMPLERGRLAVMIGDVTGHGVGAALLTHAAQAAVRSYLEMVDDLSQVVTRLNNRLAAGVETGNVMSLLLLLLDPALRTVQYVNAGHPALLVVREGGVEVLEKTGMVLGVVADQVYRVSEPVVLSPGDVLFLHTDGVEEAMNAAREQFGDERLREHLAATRGAGAAAILAQLEAALVRHCGGELPQDDIAMIAIKVTV